MSETPRTRAEHIHCSKTDKTGTRTVAYRYMYPNAEQLERELAEAREFKREVARMCFVKHKGVWIFCHPPESVLARFGITTDLLEEK